ncbi:MAG: hypothetical protein ACW99Q_26830 [Candidatus Kariarchaeaceae archaeon]
MAKGYMQKAIDIATNSGNQGLKGWFTCMLGYLHKNDGNYDEARILNTTALDIVKGVQFEFGIAAASACLGMISTEEGRIFEAIERLELANSLYLKTIGWNMVPSALIIAYSHAGKYKDALEYAQVMISIKETINTGYGWVFIQCILAALELDQLETANKYLKQFENIAKEHDSVSVVRMIKLSEALILKKTKNIETTLKAQEILEKILENSNVEYRVRVLAIRHLCDILLFENKKFEHEKTLREAETLVYQLTSIAKKQHIIRLRFEAGILQSKLQLLFGNIEESKTLLFDLLNLAKEKKLSHYQEIVGIELQDLELNFQKWMDLVDSNISIRDLIEKSKIKDYIIQAKLLSKDLD